LRSFFRQKTRKNLGIWKFQLGAEGSRAKRLLASHPTEAVSIFIWRSLTKLEIPLIRIEVFVRDEVGVVNVFNEDVILFARFGPRVHPNLVNIDKALQKDRDVRSQSAAELRADLKHLKRDTSSGKTDVASVPAPTGSAPATSRRTVWIIASLALLLLVAGTAFLLRSPLPPPRILGSRQITNDGLQKLNLVTDGRRIYFMESSGSRLFAAQVSSVGGQVTPIEPGFILDVSPDGSELLTFVGGPADGSFFSPPPR
jgi:hypothetical protein